MSKINVLITAASRKVALVRGFVELKKRFDFMGKVIAVDCDPLSPALRFADKKYIVPLIEDPQYFDELNKIIENEKIKLIIPTMDLELPLWGERKGEYLQRGVVVACSGKSTALISNDKIKTYEFFKGISIKTPETWTKDNLPSIENLKFPLFIKPRYGRGSIDCHKIKDREELYFYLEKVNNPVIQQYIKGQEFTVDLISDFDGTVLSIVPRKRLTVRAGISDRGQTFYNREIIESSRKIAEALEIRGPANIQGFVTKDSNIYFTEINPRFSGGIQLTKAAGVNFMEILLRLVNGERIKPFIGKFEKGLYMSSFEDSVFFKLEKEDKN